MTAKTDATPDADDDPHDPSKAGGMLNGGSDGEPDAVPPKPLDHMPVAPLTEPDDTGGG